MQVTYMAVKSCYRIVDKLLWALMREHCRQSYKNKNYW